VPEQADDRGATLDQTTSRAHTAASTSVLETADSQRPPNHLGNGWLSVGRQAQRPAATIDPPRLSPVQRRLEVSTPTVAQPQPTLGCRKSRPENTSLARAPHRRSRRRSRARRRPRPERIVRGRRA
jgi:hypothetical protein